MKHIGKIIFIASCLFFCILPVAGMAVCRGGAGTENRELAEFPQIKEDGKWNIGFLQGLGAYFKDHFAFRPYLVSADAIVQSKVFGVSNVERVVLGENGWLYYAATIDDYLGRNVMSERGVYNAAHNLSLLQKYVQGKGAEFAFTIAPNKNSLYGEHMPYYLQKKEESLSNRMLLEPELEKQGMSAHVEITESENNMDYWKVFGVLEGQGCNKDTQIYIRVLQGEEAKVYEPFFLTTEASDYGYCLYLKKEHLLGKATVEVIVGQDGVLQAVQSLETQQ